MSAMVRVAPVRFRRAGKVYYFDPGELELAEREPVVVETQRGFELGELARPVTRIPEEEVVKPLRRVVRKATEEDLAVRERVRERQAEAFRLGLRKIADHNLPMKLVEVQQTLDGDRMVFSFTADGRVDFRALVRDLASALRMRVELRQIGSRDAAKIVGGLGPCGLPTCCSSFLTAFTPVSIRAAKQQGLALNPAKLSGLCDRLMCCLTFEADQYQRGRLVDACQQPACPAACRAAGRVAEMPALAAAGSKVPSDLRVTGDAAEEGVEHGVSLSSWRSLAAAIAGAADESNGGGAAPGPAAEGGGPKPRRRSRQRRRGRGSTQANQASAAGSGDNSGGRNGTS